MPEHVITEADNEKTIDVRKGDFIKLQLPENPSTGYRWNIDQHDPSVLEPLGSPAFASPGNAVGAGGGKHFTFAARSIGTSEVGLSLRRKLNVEEVPKKHFHLRVRVQD